MNLSSKARVYLWFVVALGVFVAVNVFSSFSFEDQHGLAILLLLPLAFLAEIYEIRILNVQSVSVSTAIYTGAVFLGGSSFSMLIAVPAMVLSEIIIRYESIPEEAPPYAILRPILFNTSQVIISIAAASVVFELLGGSPPPYHSAIGFLIPLVAFVVYTFSNETLVSGIVALTQETNFLHQLKFSLTKLHIQLLSMGALSILIAVLYSISPWNVLLITVLMVMVHASLRNYMTLRKEARNTFEKITELLSMRDPYTARHSEAVAALAECIASEEGLDEDRVATIVSAAKVHDIGKIAIPDDILLKPGKLNDEEWKIMKKHPEIGADILKDLQIYKNSVDIVRYEHERWNGNGYPEGLKGRDIPIGARIVAAADIWNALITERPYRGPLSKSEAIELIKEMKREELDPKIADSLLSVVNRRGTSSFTKS